MILEGAGQVPLEITPFAEAILHEQPHPDVYLQIGISGFDAGRSNLHVIKTSTGHVLALWLYRVDGFAVNVMYAEKAAGWEGLQNTWHPRFGTNRWEVTDFQAEKPPPDASASK